MSPFKTARRAANNQPIVNMPTFNICNSSLAHSLRYHMYYKIDQHDSSSCKGTFGLAALHGVKHNGFCCFIGVTYDAVTLFYNLISCYIDFVNLGIMYCIITEFAVERYLWTLPLLMRSDRLHTCWLLATYVTHFRGYYAYGWKNGHRNMARNNHLMTLSDRFNIAVCNHINMFTFWISVFFAFSLFQRQLLQLHAITNQLQRQLLPRQLHVITNQVIALRQLLLIFIYLFLFIYLC